MCGIVGVIGSKTATTDVLAGLKRLAYRGYDSAGIATCVDGKLDTRKAAGKISQLEAALDSAPLAGGSKVAIGHTRWATHGEPTKNNAHPHVQGKCAVVHNGIIENFLSLRKKLGGEGVTFSSETDSETIPALIQKYLGSSINELAAVIKTTKETEGAYAIGSIFSDNDKVMIGTRSGAPLVVGISENVNYLASDPVALASFTNEFIFLENNDIAVLTANEVKIYDNNGVQVVRPIKRLNLAGDITGKAGYRHFMQKELFEQPTAIADTLKAYVNNSKTRTNWPKMPFDLAEVPQINIIACGTSAYASMVAKYWIEDLAKTPVNIDVASEFRYRNPPLVKNGLGIFVSQSGETADTLAALEHVKNNNNHILSIVNVPESSIARMSDVVLQTHAGIEIGVASTKAFTTQLTMFALLALEIATRKKTLNSIEISKHLKELEEIPVRMNVIMELNDKIQSIAKDIVHATSALYLGRNNLYPIAMEGALKLKEISYIHAEGYASGEMKHGPIALIDEDVPVITLAPSGSLFEKSISNMKEVEARQGKVILITDVKGAKIAGDNPNRTTLIMPDVPEFLHPIYYAIPMQLLAYHVAVLKGTDVDQPRNLAKSVTVE